MFHLYRRSNGRIIHLQTHGSAEILLTMAEEGCRATGFALLLGPVDSVMFRLDGDDVCVYGGGANLSAYLRRSTKVVRS